MGFFRTSTKNKKRTKSYAGAAAISKTSNRYRAKSSRQGLGSDDEIYIARTKSPTTWDEVLLPKRLSPRILGAVTSNPNPNKQVRNHSNYTPLLYTPTSSTLGTSASPRVSICERRATRTEVLHATGKTGKSGQKPRSLNKNSHIKCK